LDCRCGLGVEHDALFGAEFAHLLVTSQRRLHTLACDSVLARHCAVHELLLGRTALPCASTAALSNPLRTGNSIRGVRHQSLL
jgi:hypothetical protein